MEVFRDVVGYEGQYKIGSCGTLWSERSRKVLRPNTDKDGYGYYVLCVNGKRKTIKTHRLVATAFLPNENNLPSVNHKDEDKTNNNVNNLEWCSAKYNVNYGSRTEKASKKVICVTTGKVFKSIAEASKYYNLRGNHISACCKGKLKSCGKHPITGEKLVWKYL